MRFALGAATFICVLTCAPSHALRSQQFAPSGTVFGFGYFSQLNGMGTRYAGNANLHAGPAVMVGYEVHPGSSPFGARLAIGVTLTSGYDFAATSSCLYQCDAGSERDGRFMAVSLGVTRSVQIGSGHLELGIGPAFRKYVFPDLVCACDPPSPFEDPQRIQQPLAYFNDESALGAWLGAGVRIPVGRVNTRLGIDYYGSHGSAPGLRHDLIISATATLP